MQTQKPPRPAGVTIIAILALLIGVVGLMAGFAIVALTGLFASLRFLGLGGLIASLGPIIASVVFVFSFIWLLTGWGFLSGKGWAWTLGLIFSILSILGGLIFAVSGSVGGIVAVVIWVLMVYYLMTGRVKAFFGKGPAFPSTFTAGPPAISRPSISSASMVGTPSLGSMGSAPTPLSAGSNRFCTNCGTAVSPGLTKCSNCGANL